MKRFGKKNKILIVLALGIVITMALGSFALGESQTPPNPQGTSSESAAANATETSEANDGITYNTATKALTIGAGIYNASTIKTQGVDAHPDLVSVVFEGPTTINGDIETGLFKKASSLTNFSTNGTITLNGTAGVGMFQHCTALTKLDLHDLDTSNATSLWVFFDGCFALQEVNLSSFNTSKCSGSTGLQSFFSDCRALKEVDVSNFDITQTIILKSFFKNCYALTTIKGIENWDITGKDVTNMLSGCNALASINCDTFRLTSEMALPNPASGTYWFPTSASLSSGISTAANLITYTTNETYREKYGTSWFRAASDPHVFGDFYVTGDTNKVSFASNVLTIAGGTVTISMVEGKASTSQRIAIDANAPGANITLNGVNITATDGAAFTIPNGASFAVQILLKDGSKNILQGKAGGNGVPGTPGIQKRNEGTGLLIIGVPEGSAGTGELDVIGGHATAGIGGDYQMNGGNIRIDAGVVNATGGNGGAAIGGGSWANVSGRSQGNNITINGGTVTARAGYAAAAIGGGWTGSGNNITIAGGTVYAYGGVPTPPDGIEGGSAIGSGFEAKDVASGNTVNGNAIVYATSGSAGRAALDGFSGTGLSQGIVFSRQSEAGTWTGAQYGDVTLSQNVTFPANLTVGGGDTAQTLTVDYNTTVSLGSTTLTNGKKGTITINKDESDPTKDGSISGGTIKTVVGYSVPTGATQPADGTFTYTEAGTAYGTLPTPSLTDTTFKGWYKESTHTNQITSTSNVELNLHTLYGEFNYPFVVSDGEEGTDYAFDTANKTLTIKTNTQIEIENVQKEVATSWRIEIDSNASGANITLDGVNISTSAGPAFKIPDNFANDVTITLADGSENFLLATAGEKAGLQKSSDGTGVVGTLYIKGDTGSLTASGGVNAAAIGSALLDNGAYGSCENIEISGGYINATGGHNSGAIGSGNRGNGTNITITGGNIVAAGGSAGTGIGAGHLGTGSNITISGGVVKASSLDRGAGIGGGASGKAVNVSITGGIVQATGGAALAGIVGAAIGGSNDFSSTGNTLHGNAVLIATSGDASRAALDGFTTTQGILFSRQGSSGTWTSSMEGSVEISQDVAFPANLTVGGGDTAQTLTVDYNTTVSLGSTTLTNGKKGTITINKDESDPTRDGSISGGTIKTVVGYSVPTGATQPADGTFTYTEAGTAYGTLPTSSLTGKNFKGWYKESTYTNQVTSTSNVELNLHTLYGKFSYPFIVSGGTEGTDYSFDSTKRWLNIFTAKPLEISNTDPEASVDWCIALASNAPGANITFNGVNISCSTRAAFVIPQDFANPVNITVADGSENYLSSTAENYPGIEKSSTGTGGGSLTIQGGSAGSGTLTCTGAMYGPGLGSRFVRVDGTPSPKYANNIYIKGCHIIANAGEAAAGIGGAYYGGANNIQILDGAYVEATSNVNGAAIGGGDHTSADRIVIENSTVVAHAGPNAAAIGGGRAGNGTNISISGNSRVTAVGGTSTEQDTKNTGASAIGGGASGGSGSNNSINGNAVVLATSGNTVKEALQGFDSGLTKGIAFTQKTASGDWSGNMYGSVTLSKNVTFPANLTVGGGDTAQTLTVDYNTTVSLGSTTLTNGKKGTITINKDESDPTRDGHISGGTIKTVVGYSVPTGATQPADGTFTYTEAGTAYGTLPTSSLTGKNFKGWYKESTYTNQVTSTSNVELNQHTLYGKFVNLYTVTFNVPTGTAPQSQTIDDGSKATDPQLSWADGTVEGWYTDQAFTPSNKWNFGTDTVTSNITLYAKFTCSVTFNSQGGSTVAGATVVYNNTVSEPTAPTRSGYRFDGWYKESACTNKWTFTTAVTKNTTLYAKWVQQFTVTFSVPTGTAPSAQTLDTGSKVTAPQISWTDGTVEGWYKEDTYQNKWNFATDTVTGNITLYAKFQCTVTFNPNYSGGTSTTGTAVYNNTITAPTPPTRTGYRFDGWYKEAACTNEWDFSTNTVTANMILYAKWVQQFTVTFNVPTGTAPAAQTLDTGSKATVPQISWTDGTVEGWYTDQAFTPANKWNFNTDTVTGNITLYAKFQCTVTFDSNYSGGSSTTGTAVYNNPVAEPTAPTRSGYRFDGWYKESACTNKWTFTTAVTKNTTLYAKWVQQFTVTFSVPTGTAPAAQTIDDGSKVADPQISWTYGTVEGWYTDQAFTPANKWNFDVDTVTGDITLYARFQYTVTFNVPTGTAPQAQNVDIGGKATDPQLIWTGGTVEGWYTDQAFTPANKWNFGTDTVTGNITLYAKFTCSVTFNSQGGSTVSGETVVYDNTVQEPDEPTRDGYSFVEWCKEVECTNPWDFENDKIQGDTTIYAKWLGDEHNVTILSNPDDHGTVTTDTDNPKTGDEVIITVTPEEGYKVDGLPIVKTEDGRIIEVVPTGNPNEYKFIMPDSDVTIEVHFVLISEPAVDPDGGDGSSSSSKTGDPFMGGVALAILGLATTGAVMLRKRK